jgi:hypothetical protein
MDWSFDMEWKIMKLMVLDYVIIKKGSYLFLLKYGNQEKKYEINVIENGIQYLEYDNSLKDILCKNIGAEKEFHRLLFNLHNEKGRAINLPFEIGDF